MHNPYRFEDFGGQPPQEFFAKANLALRRLIDLLKEAELATTKEEAEIYIKELTLAEFQATRLLEPFSANTSKDIRQLIRSQHGDYAKLTTLFTKLGVL